VFFRVSKQLIINHEQKEFEFEFGSGISSAPDELKELDMFKFKPTLQTSTSEDLVKKLPRINNLS
jgi:hypothetical protein